MTTLDYIVLGALAVTIMAGIATLRNRARSDRLTTDKGADTPHGPLDRRVALISGAVVGMAVILIAAISISGSSGPIPSTNTELSSTGLEPVRLSRRQKLENLSIGALSWSKEGFGNVMIASFRIDNNNPDPVKDVEVTCVHSSNSGTVIDSNRRTIYEIIAQHSYFYVRDMNMGFIHSQAVRSQCQATDFVG